MKRPHRPTCPKAAPALQAGAGRAALLALPGVGPTTAERLVAAGMLVPTDLLYLIPRRWDDLRTLTPVGALVPGVAQLTRATVTGTRVMFGRRRFLAVSLVGDDGAKLSALWFFVRAGLKERFAKGARFLLAGTPRPYHDGLQISHPETVPLDPDSEGDAFEGAVRARYPEVAGVPGRLIERLCRHIAATSAATVDDGVPEAIRVRRGLPSQGEALSALHLAGADDPPPEAIDALNRGATAAHRRLAFDELFFFQLGLARRRAALRCEDARACPPCPEVFARLLAALPYPPTGAQRRAIDAISRDLARPHPMQRLLQGDVGAGKTLVMFAAAAQALTAGRQVAIMAPTELLAEQHLRTLTPWALAIGLAPSLLTAATPRTERTALCAALASGQRALVIGTHALLVEDVAFADLALVVIDEQHRFGVAQRAALRGKSERLPHLQPHLLVMTATPIPRTLALTLHGDLDLTVLDELPPGRPAVTTRVCTGARGRAEAFRMLAAALHGGAQGFVVCPVIEEGGAIDFTDGFTAAAVATHRRLTSELPGMTVGLIHGRLAAAERDEVMARFRSGDLRLLVATTVVEVGVDVPAATVMLIEGADRFGLAQLHQLRGRIGRSSFPDGADGPGREPALCLLVTDVTKTSEAARRLAVMARTRDGFVIAEEDLRLRGPGDLLGARQAGLPLLRFADLARDLPLLADARADAFELLDEDPDLAHHPATRALLAQRWSDRGVTIEESA
ncbi:MAG: ATP-dependent DNA helicase RecG [Myxococcales bacterium]|nr:ATP-dependent DNA helicase RecG [Myxococcales bacterium]